MKKTIINLLLFTVIAFLAACDPVKDNEDFDKVALTADELSSRISLSLGDSTSTAAGQEFVYSTNPATIVQVFNYSTDGSEKSIVYGNTSGTFFVKYKRGSETTQSIYFRVVNDDNSEVVVEKSIDNVFVPGELSDDVKLLASDSYGSKIWKWDTSITGAVWGNMGYCGGNGSDVGISGNGQWWGCTSEEDFLGQLQHTEDGEYHGDGDVDNSYMEFTDDGTLTSYDADGGVIRTGSYTVENYDPDYSESTWKVGDLVTTAILWPYEINSGGNIPGTYEICYLTADKLTLVYPDGGNYSGLGNWGEASFWHFKSGTDIDGMAFGYGTTASKSWTWDQSITGAVWGNMGYCGGNGSDVGISGNGQWWGCTSEEDFLGQLNHTNDGLAHGDESMDAYFTLTGDGTIERHAGDGTLINSGTFSFDQILDDAWKQANLNTTAGTILWPYEINSGGNMPTIFEVVYLTSEKMTLVYPDGGDLEVGLGNWGEASFWHFKVKE